MAGLPDANASAVTGAAAAGAGMSAPLRAVRLGPTGAEFSHAPDGCIYVRAPEPLAPYPAKLTERLDYWAATAPERVFVAKRKPDGTWRTLSYAATLAAVRQIGQAILARPLSAERPIAILSENDIEHLLLALAAMYVGVPYAPISPAYSLISSDFGKLRHVLQLLTPGLVFAADGERYGRAIAAAVPPDAELLVTAAPPGARAATLFADLVATAATPAVDAAHGAVGPDTVAKILFTSGSTGMPKGVINTQRMLCSNQVMLRTSLAFMQEQPPVIVDWLPWNHTFGGNHNVGLVLYNGGSLYIDDGKPTPEGIDETVRNLREIAPTIFFNVPKGYEALIPYLRREPALRQTFFSRLQLMFYSAAGMAQYLWDALDELAVQSCGERIVMLTGLGATESAPFAIVCDQRYSQSGNVGLPVPGVELKLAPVAGKMEARLRGPNVTPGYWRQPSLTEQAFDAEGFYKLGDALLPIDPDDPQKGFKFDGRITEDFKLATGTWVSVGPLRARIIEHSAPYVRDVVIAGIDRDEVTALVLPDFAACRRLCGEAGADLAPAGMVAHGAVRQKFRELFASLAAVNPGSSRRIARAILLYAPLSIDAGEVTDKGSINQRAVLAHRAELVAELYRVPPPPQVIVVGERAQDMASRC